MEVTDSVEQRIDGRLADGEQVREASVDDDRLLAVTDRRVIEVVHEDENREKWEFDTTLLADGSVVGVEINERGEGSPDTLLLAVGVVTVCGSLLAISAFSGGAALVVGAFLAVFGLILIVGGLDTDGGDVSVTIRRSGETPNDEFSLEQANEHLATKISTIVAEAASTG